MVIHWRTAAKMASSAPMVTTVRVWVRISIIVVIDIIVTIFATVLVGTNGAIGDPIPLEPISPIVPFVPMNQRLAPS